MRLPCHIVLACSLLIAVAASAGLTACAPATILAVGASSVAVAATNENSPKTIGTTVDDIKIDAAVNRRLFETNLDLFSALTVTVEKGRVFLTGSVQTPEHRIEATRQAWQVENVREVVNEIQVRDTSSLVDRAKDIVISTRLRAGLLLDKDVNSVGFSVDTINGVIYLFGIARDAEERERVNNHARNLQYVVDVVNHIVLADGQ